MQVCKGWRGSLITDNPVKGGRIALVLEDTGSSVRDLSPSLCPSAPKGLLMVLEEAPDRSLPPLLGGLAAFCGCHVVLAPLAEL